MGRILDGRPGQFAIDDGEEESPGATHSCRFRGCGDSGHNTAQDHEDKGHGWKKGGANHLEFLSPRVDPLLLGKRRSHGGIDTASNGDVDKIEGGEEEARRCSSGEELSHRHSRLRTIYHQHDTGRDDNPQGPPGANTSGGQRDTVSPAHEGRCCEKTDRHLGGAYHTGRGCKDGACKNHGQGQSAPNGPQNDMHGVKKFFRDAGGIQHLSHENEQGHRHKDILLHNAVGSVGQEPEDHVGRSAPTDHPEDHCQYAQGKGQGVPQEQGDKECAEHDQG